MSEILFPDQPPDPTATMSSRQTQPEGHVFCIQCGYDLHGLSADKRCPECGTPIDRSLRGTLLQFSSPDYLSSLHRGVFLILASIIIQVLFAIFAMIGSVAFQVTTAPGMPVWFESTLNLVSIALGLALLYGWWLFSAPDPAFLGRDKGTTARQVVRASVALAVLLSIANFFVNPNVGTSVATGTAAVALAVLVGLLSLAITGVKFFASMLYLRWLAARIPSAYLDRRAKLYMWLLPVLAIPGSILCGLGALVALILYWNLLDRVRKDIKRIKLEAIAEFGTGYQSYR